MSDRFSGWLAAALLSVVACSSSAHAQYVPASDYCVQGGACYDSLERAEAALKSTAPYGPYAQRDRESVDSNGNLRITYRLADRVPAAVQPAVFAMPTDPSAGFCQGANPALPHWCDTEVEATDRFLATDPLASTGCVADPAYWFASEYLPRAAALTSVYAQGQKYGILRYSNLSGGGDFDSFGPIPTKVAVINAQCGRYAKRYFYALRKNVTFTCPAGYSPKAQHQIVVAELPSEPAIATTKLCFSNTTLTIYAKVRQTQSCKIGNPCHPSTGEKSRAEVDFQVGSRSFVRHYRSLRQFDTHGFAPGWSHTYTERVLTSGGLGVVADNGSYYGAVPVGNYRYRLENTEGDVLEYVSGGDIRYRVRRGGEIREFGSDGRLRYVRFTDGRSHLALIYGDEGLSSVVDDQGRGLSFQYTSNRLSAVVGSDGARTTYEYDSEGNLAVVRYTDGAFKQYHYAEPAHALPEFKHHLTGITSETGQRYAHFSYDNYGRVIASQLVGASGLVESTTLTYDARGLVTVVDSAGLSRVYRFGSDKYLLLGSTADFSGTTSYVYSSGRLESLTSAGVTTRFAYAPLYRSATTVGAGTASQRTEEIVRDEATQQVALRLIRDATSVIRAEQSWIYNSRGQVRSATTSDTATGLARTSTSDYCEQPDVDAGVCPRVGLLLSADGPRTDVADVTTYTYYPTDATDCAVAPTTCAWRKGDLWKVTNALGQTTETLRYDGAGRVLSVRDANRVITDMEYHPRGWLTARKVRGADNSSESDDLITRIDYYPTGLVQRTTLPDGSYTEFAYDAAHRLTGVSDAEGNRLVYTLDNAGNRTKEETVGQDGTVLRTLSRVFNQLGQLQTQRDAYQSATSFTYDANGNTDKVTDGLGRVSDNDYDPLNRLIRTVQDVGGINATTQFQYDALDQLTAVVDPNGLTTGYAYNGLGDLVQLSSPDTGVTTYGHDSAGNRTTQTDARGVTTGYVYDALNRLTGVHYPTAGLNVTYTYDLTPAMCGSGETHAVGRLTGLSDASGSTQYCYDRFGRLVRKVQTTNGHTFVLRYAYTKAGQLSALQYPDSTVADYVRDGLGRVTEVGVTRPGQLREVLLSGTRHYPFGPVQQWTFGNGRTLLRVLDQNYAPGAIEDSAGGLSLGYEFDAAGNLSTLRDGLLSDPPKARYGYDGLNRLTEVKDGATGTAIDAYAYDATGNRLSVTRASGPTGYSYAPDSHRLLGVGATSRSYDAAGNTTAIGARQFSYNDAGRLAQVTGAQTVDYAYNGKGEQVLRTSGTDIRTFVYDEAGHWLGAYGADGAPIQQVIWLDDLPVGVIDGGTLHYIEADHLGTPRAIVEPQRNVVVWKWELTGEAFGETPPKQDVDGDGQTFVLDLRFPGQRYDAASGLNYNYFRDYEPTTGRYVQSDPVGLRGGINTFSYTNSKPLTAIDPRGLEAWVGCPDGSVAPAGTCSTPWPQPDLSPCAYYAQVCRQTGCEYYCSTAPRMCEYGAYVPPFIGVSTPGLNCVRRCLVREDAKSRAGNSCGSGRCLPSSEIDRYHRTCYTECNVSNWRYPGVEGPFWNLNSPK